LKNSGLPYESPLVSLTPWALNDDCHQRILRKVFKLGL
jgi:hypothetical protein